MARLDLHGLKIDVNSLQKASRETQKYNDDACYDEIFYDTASGEVWTQFHYSIGHNSWTVYRDPDVIKVGQTRRHMTQQEIADAIAVEVAHLRMIEEWCER